MDINLPPRDCVFMNIASELSRLSKDPKTKVGAVIVSPEHFILGQGYNGLLREMKDSERLWKWKHSYVIHAEINAIKNSGGAHLYGCRIYTTLFPCLNCAKTILAWGIEEIIYRDKRQELETECQNLLKEMSHSVKVRQLIGGM